MQARTQIACLQALPFDRQRLHALDPVRRQFALELGQAQAWMRRGQGGVVIGQQVEFPEVGAYEFYFAYDLADAILGAIADTDPA